MAAVVKADFSFRSMTEADFTHVMQIEQRNYEFPWSQNIFRDCIRAGYHCVVGEVDAEVIAYGVISIAVGECHILNVSVSPKWQGYGLGRKLVMHLIQMAVDKKAQLIILEVRPSNVIATNLYYSLGFEYLAIRKGYYPGQKGREDALVLGYHMILPEDHFLFK